MGMVREPNYGYLLGGILIFLLIGPMARTLFGAADGFILLVSYNAMLIIGIWSLLDKRIHFIAGLMLAALSVSLAASRLLLGLSGLTIDLISMTLFLSFQVISLIITCRHVFTATKVNLNLLIGSACIFMLLGMIWAVFYMFAVLLEPDAFTGLDNTSDTQMYWDMTYFSFVTMTTLGYGDISPIGPLTRALAYMEAVTGQIYTVVLVGVLVGAYSRPDPSTIVD